MRKNSVVAIFMATCLVLLGAAWCTAEEIQLQSGQSVLTHSPKATPEEVEAFWTQERMLQAMSNPMDKLILLDDLELTITGDEPAGVPVSEAGYCPDCVGNKAEKGDMDDQTAGQQISAPCPASGYAWGYRYSNNTEYPYRVVGRLFFTTETGGLAVCSASLVNRRMILTAGHCVSSGAGHWYSNFYFIPGYKDGAEPFGRGYANSMYTFSNWFNSGTWSHDVGMIILTADMGHSLGWLGFSANRDPGAQEWYQFGYPAAEPFDGRWLVLVLSRLGYRVSGIGSPYPCAVGSIMTQGASGGPWYVIADDNRYANGLNSAKPVSCSETTISPYFGTDVWNMYELVKGKQP